jgi:Tol biopolymer transport system component
MLRWTPLALALLCGSSAAQGFLPVTTRASSTPGGAAGNAASRHADLSFDGRFVAFESAAADLVPLDGNGTWDIFVRDRVLLSTERASTGPLGLEADGPSFGPALSDDGRFVAFESDASNLVFGDTGYRDVFLHDRLAGATVRISMASGGQQPNGDSRDVRIDPTGRFVLFRSAASNLVPGDTNGFDDVFLYDHFFGSIERVSISTAGAEGDGPSFPASLSSGAGRVAFWSDSSTLVRGDTNHMTDVFVRDRVLGTTERVSLGPPTPAEPAGAELSGFSREGDLTADGSEIAYASTAAGVVPEDTNGADDVFVRELATGTTTLLDKTSLGVLGSGNSYHPRLSADGRFCAFESFDAGLTPMPNAWGPDIYVTDRATGFTAQVSLASSGATDHVMSIFPALSGDGHSVAFHSVAAQLVTPDANKVDDVFVHERKSVALLTVDPLVAGGHLVLGISGAPPLGGVAVGWTLAGQWATGSPFGILDLAAPFFVFSLPVDASGGAGLVVPLPLALSGSTLFFQGIDSNLMPTSSIGRPIL